MRHNNQKSHYAPKKSRFADETGERYAEIEHRGGKGLQPWRAAGSNWNLRVTFAYLIYC